MNDELRRLMNDHWTALEMQPVSGSHRLRVADLPVNTDAGPLAAAVDHEGHRHILVPIDSRQRVRRALTGPVLHLRKRDLTGENEYRAYADLGCLRADLNDVFTALCADVLQTADVLSTNPIKALYRVLDRWRALFQSQGAPLGVGQLAGLFAELTVLARLLTQDPSAHRLWRGPKRHRHDFAADALAVEVKAATGGEGRRVRIHGLDQLETPVGGALQLAWFRLERTADRGQDLPRLVEEAMHRCDDESSLLGLLAEAGFRASDIDHYRDVRFVISEERWYAVDAAFPKLTGANLTAAAIPVSVTDVNYTIDLSTEPPNPLGNDQVNDHLTALIRGSA